MPAKLTTVQENRLYHIKIGYIKILIISYKNRLYKQKQAIYYIILYGL